MSIAFLQVDYIHQAMLYATDGIVTDDDFNKAMVGVASVWCVLFQFYLPGSNITCIQV